MSTSKIAKFCQKLSWLSFLNEENISCKSASHSQFNLHLIFFTYRYTVLSLKFRINEISTEQRRVGTSAALSVSLRARRG